jgi:hypothetical protein
VPSIVDTCAHFADHAPRTINGAALLIKNGAHPQIAVNFPHVSPPAIELARLEPEKRFLAARIKELTG